MDSSLFDRHIASVQQLYQYLDLSRGQAERIHLFQQESLAAFLPGWKSFSFWEEKEYEWDFFRQVLEPGQLALYEREREREVEGMEASLRKSDASEWASEIALYEEMVGWYADSFIPRFRQDALGCSIRPFPEPEKSGYLRSMYALFLRQNRQETLVGHYRQSRNLQPNVLKLSLLRHELLRLWPEYGQFVAWADAPTQTVAAFVLEQYRALIERDADFFREKAEERRTQWLSARIRHMGEPVVQVWNIAYYGKKWPEAELGMMGLLLLDRPEGGRPMDRH